MTKQERIEVGQSWIGLAQMYGRDIPQIALKIMLDAIDDLPSKEIIHALVDWSRNSKQNRHPLPAELREMLKKELSIEARANEAANRIRQAITRIGWSEPVKAKEFMGDLAWAIVERSGGWTYICENHGVDLNPLTFHAQARDSAKAIIESSKLGHIDRPMLLDERKGNLESIGNGISALIPIRD